MTGKGLLYREGIYEESEADDCKSSTKKMNIENEKEHKRTVKDYKYAKMPKIGKLC